MHHPFSTYVKIFRDTNNTYHLIRAYTGTHQGVRNASFSEQSLIVILSC